MGAVDWATRCIGCRRSTQGVPNCVCTCDPWGRKTPMLPRPAFDRPSRESPSKVIRDFIFTRDQLMCRYCGVRLSKEDATLDHVIPRSRYGENNIQNLVTACSACNQEKADRTPEEAGMKLLPVPDL